MTLKAQSGHCTDISAQHVYGTAARSGFKNPARNFRFGEKPRATNRRQGCPAATPGLLAVQQSMRGLDRGASVSRGVSACECSALAHDVIQRDRAQREA